MKTTIEIPDRLFRLAKATAAERGQTLRQLVTEALEQRLAGKLDQDRPDWMKGFGKLKRLHAETKRIQSRIDEAFDTVEPEDRQ